MIPLRSLLPERFQGQQQVTDYTTAQQRPHGEKATRGTQGIDDDWDDPLNLSIDAPGVYGPDGIEYDEDKQIGVQFTGMHTRLSEFLNDAPEKMTADVNPQNKQDLPPLGYLANGERLEEPTPEEYRKKGVSRAQKGIRGTGKSQSVGGWNTVSSVGMP